MRMLNLSMAIMARDHDCLIDCLVLLNLLRQSVAVGSPQVVSRSQGYKQGNIDYIYEKRCHFTRAATVKKLCTYLMIGLMKSLFCHLIILFNDLIYVD